MSELLGDTYFMAIALKEAKMAMEAGEIPVGAVIVSKEQIIARASNNTEVLNDVTAHAEMIALTSAFNFLGSKYLPTCTLYVTLEPCVMCAGALRWSQIGRIVYGASDEKSGFMRYGKELLHPKTKVEFGVMHDECQHLLKTFFEQKRLT